MVREPTSIYLGLADLGTVGGGEAISGITDAKFLITQALLTIYGNELMRLAKANDVTLYFDLENFKWDLQL